MCYSENAHEGKAKTQLRGTTECYRERQAENARLAQVEAAKALEHAGRNALRNTAPSNEGNNIPV
jgi:hypothetical protein